MTRQTLARACVHASTSLFTCSFIHACAELHNYSLGVRSILAKDAVGTVEFFVQMISVAMAIVTGLFAANLVVRPSRQL